MQGRYPIRAVAKITGLSLDTLRAWERRYQAVVPERSERGREYGPAQIERLLLLSRLVQNGHSIGRIASLSDSELTALLAQGPAAKTDIAPDLLHTVIAAIEEFDATRASDELGRLAALLPPRDLVYRVAAPLMREAGTRWHTGAHHGSMGIAQEHLVSQLLRNLLGSMMRLFHPHAAAAKIVFATPAGESHDFGILAAAMLAAIAGFEPVYLGPDLPAAEIAQAARRTAARVVSVAVTLPTETSREEIRSLAAWMPNDTELWVGGAGAGEIDISGLEGRVLRIADLPAFENECSRLR